MYRGTCPLLLVTKLYYLFISTFYCRYLSHHSFNSNIKTKSFSWFLNSSSALTDPSSPLWVNYNCLLPQLMWVFPPVDTLVIFESKHQVCTHNFISVWKIPSCLTAHCWQSHFSFLFGGWLFSFQVEKFHVFLYHNLYGLGRCVNWP